MSEGQTLSPKEGLFSAWEWFVTDHSHRGHSNYCGCIHGPEGENWIENEEKDCDCGFVNLRNVIQYIVNEGKETSHK